jgi:hypothetical protein
MSLRDAVSTLASHGFGTEVSGSGYVVAQHPRPGAKLAVGENCHVRLTESLTRSGGRRAG